MIRNFVLDVDGVLTDGRFYYTADGKVMKAFGAHDAEGLNMLRKAGVRIHFISADRRGFPITYRRIFEDMKFHVSNVSEEERLAFVEKEFGFEETAYMGDGYSDAPLLRACAITFAPSSARKEAKEAADIIT